MYACSTVFDSSDEDGEYKVSISVKTKEGYDLIVKEENCYDVKSQM